MNRDSPPEPTRADLALIAAQAAEIATLKARIAGLDRHLELNSSNSGKPPSSTGLKNSARGRSVRNVRPESQTGKPITRARLCGRPPNPMSLIYTSSCSECGASLDPEMSVGHAAR